MKKILALILTIIMIASVFALPVMAEEDAIVLTENYGKVKVQGKVQSNGSVAFAVRSSFGESKTQDVIQYFVSPRGQETTYGMENNQAFDFHKDQRLVSKTVELVFENITAYGGDERTPVSLSGFGWIGAGHGTTCAVNVIGEHKLTYANIGDTYKDKDGIEWVLLRVSEVEVGTEMQPSLVFISKNLRKGNDTNPGFYTLSDAHIGTDLVNTADETNKVTISAYKNSAWLRPAYNMTKQDVYVVNGGEKTLVTTDGTVCEGDYVIVEETYTIMNPVYVAETIIANRPDGGYTENPNLAVGKELVTFDLEHIYNPDGTVVHNWETTYHQDATLGEFGGIQYGKKGDFIYLPGTKPFTMKSVDFDFTNLLDTTTGYPDGYATIDCWADTKNVPNRRLDFNKSGSTFDKAFAGGQLPVFNGEPAERVQNTDRAFYFWNTKKAYHFSVGGSSESAGINKRYPDLTGVTLKGSAYKKWIEDFDANGTYSYYSVPYFSDGDTSRYMYFDLYKPGVTKKYDISAYLGTYSISELEKTANLDYEINYETGILTVSSLENNQTSADTLVLKAKYVGESIPAVEMKIRALPALYDVSINDKLAEIAELMESVGASEEEYAADLIAKYNSLLSQKEAYEQAIKDEAANADRVAGLNNRYEYFDIKGYIDVFATDNDLAHANWMGVSSTVQEPNLYAYKGFGYGESSLYPTASTDNYRNNGYAFKTSALLETVGITPNDDGSYNFATGNISYKLGDIKTADGQIGANAWIPRSKYDTTLYSGTPALNTVSSSGSVVYNAPTGASNKVTYNVNKDGYKSINFLTTKLNHNGTRATFFETYVKHTGETEKKYIQINPYQNATFANSIKLFPVEEYNKLADYTADMAAKGDNTWTATSDASYITARDNSKFYQMEQTGKIVSMNSLMTVDQSKLSARNTQTNIALPTESAKFVNSSKSTNVYAHTTTIPADPSKTLEYVRIEANLTSPTDFTVESGGCYYWTGTTITKAALRLNYDGKETVTIDGVEYIVFAELTRDCADTIVMGLTLENDKTWQDKIDELNTKIEALEIETTTKTQIAEIKEEINALLAANTNIVYVKDFSEEARTKITDIEEYLKTHFSEEDRLVMLAERTYEYLDIEPDIDLFATWEEITEYARFNKSASGTSTVSLGTTAYTGTNSEITQIFDWIPQTKSDGKTAIKGKEGFYSKGMIKLGFVLADNIYVLDSLTAPEGTTKVTGMRVGANAQQSNKDYVDGTVVRKSAEKKITQSHIVERLNEDGFVTVQNGQLKHKIGPLKTDGTVSPNGRNLTANTASIITDATGTSLDVMIATNDINCAYYTSSKLPTYSANYIKEDGTAAELKSNANTYAVPQAGLQEVVINYADGDKETKYVLSMTTATAEYLPWYSANSVENAIVYAPKYDEDGREIVYDENSFYINGATSGFKYLTKYNQKTDKIAAEYVQPEDVTFVNKNIIMSAKGNVAEVVSNRQDAMGNAAGNDADIASIPLKNKQLASVVFKRNVGAALNADTAIKVATDQKDSEGATRAPIIALLPVEIEGASDEFVYFAYCGRIGSGSYLVSATVSSSKADLIKAANEEILAAETAEEAEAVIVKYIDNLYTKYRDLSDEARAYYEELTDSKATIRLVAEGAGYKATAFTKEEANKPYTIILVSYDDKENFISAQKIDGTTKDAIYYEQIFNSVPEGTAKVKAYLWKDLITLKPLAGNVAEV